MVHNNFLLMLTGNLISGKVPEAITKFTVEICKSPDPVRSIQLCHVCEFRSFMDAGFVVGFNLQPRTFFSSTEEDKNF